MAGTEASFSPCCPIPLAEGCQTNGTARWASVRNPDGSISLIDPITGATVPPASAAAFCAPGSDQSHLVTVAASSVFAIPTANLESWAIRARGTGVSVVVNGGASNALDDNEVIEASAQDDDTLTDTVTITTGPGATARVLYTTRL